MRAAILIVALGLVGCVGEYHPTSQFPPTPDRQVAFRTCVDAAMRETPQLPGLIANAIEGPSRTEIQDECMLAHGWARN